LILCRKSGGRWARAVPTSPSRGDEEIYIQHEAWPHPVLRHELAHVFAGAAGDRLFRLSMAGVIPQLGLVEGIAVAADRRVTGNVALHQSVRAMRQAGLLPPLEQVFSGLGFWALPSGRAYTVAGSFSRYLLTQYGAGKLLAVYHAGGRPQDFARSYGFRLPSCGSSGSSSSKPSPCRPKRARSSASGIGGQRCSTRSVPMSWQSAASGRGS
jgi:hypothetical protein